MEKDNNSMAPKRFAILYIHSDDGISIKHENIQELIYQVATETNNHTLDWGYIGGRCFLSVDKKEENNVPIIIQTLLDKGNRIFINDGTEVTFEPGMTYNQINKEKLLLKSFNWIFDRYDGNNNQVASMIASLGMDRFLNKEFWTIEEGKEWTTQFNF